VGDTLLVIDNDEGVRYLLATYFNDKGFDVVTAVDGLDGVNQALRHRPEVIICDIVMPQMHGFEVLETLHGHRDLAETIIIVVSAKAYKPDRDRALEMGADAYFVKPFDLPQLSATIEQARAHRRAS
jgi:two-component system sensor histidine kinase/response regulator